MADNTRIKQAEDLMSLETKLRDLFKEQSIDLNKHVVITGALEGLHDKIKRSVNNRMKTDEKIFKLEVSIKDTLSKIAKISADTQLTRVLKEQQIAKLIADAARDQKKLTLEQQKLASHQFAVQQLGLNGIVNKLEYINKLWGENKMLVVAVAGLAIWKRIFSVFKDMDEAAAGFRKTMGVTREYTQNIDMMARSLAFSLAQVGVNATIAYDAISGLGSVLGSTSYVTKGMAEDVSLMAAQFGIASKDSATFMRAMAIVGKDLVSSKSSMLIFTQKLSEAAGTPLGEVMGDISQNVKDSYSYISRSSVALIKAAVEAKRMGTSLTTTVGSAKGLLNFTRSVGAEMEASVLLGEAVNLQRARELSYRRDLAGLNKEILKILKETNFEQLDPFQQEALAASLGKSAGELGQMAQAEKQMRALEGDRTKGVQEQLAAYKSMTKLNEDNAKALANSARDQLRIKANQSAITSITQSWNAILQRVGEVFLPVIAKGLAVVASILNKVTSFLNENPWTKWLLGGVAVVTGIFTVIAAFKVLSGLLGSIGKAAGAGIEGVLTGVSKGVSSFGKPPVMKGALGILLLAAALIPLAVAMKIMEGVSWKTVGVMIVSLVALAAAAAVIGIPAVAGLIFVGALAIGALGLALIPFAAAAWIASKALQNLSEVKWLDIAKGIFAVGIQSPMILGMGLAMGLAAPGIIAFSLALIPLSIMAKKAGDSMMNMGMGMKLMVDSLERIQNISLIGTVLQVRNLAKAVTELSQAVKSMPNIEVDKIERLQMKGAAAGEAAPTQPKDTALVDEVRGMRDELKKLREDFASGTLKATVNIDSQKVDAATGRSLEFKGALV